MVIDSERAPAVPAGFSSGLLRGLGARRPQIVTLGVGLLLAILIWGAPVGFRLQHEQASIAAVEAETVNLAVGFEQETAQIFMKVSLLLSFLVRDFEADPAAFQLDRWLATAPPLGSLAFQITMISPAGLLTATSMPGLPVGKDLNGRQAFHVHRDQRIGFYVGRSLTARSGLPPIMLMSRRLDNKDGSFGGVAVVSVDPGYVATFLGRLQVGRGVRATLVGEDGFVRGSAGSDGATPLAVDSVLDWPSPQQETIDHGSRHAVDPVDNIEKIYSYRRLEKFPLYAIVDFSTTEVHDDLAIDDRIAIRVASVMTAILLILMLLLVRSQERRQKDEEVVALQRDGLERLNRDLAFSQERYRSVLDNLKEVVFQTDARGRLTLLNPAWEQLTGYSVGQSLGGGFLRFVHPDDRKWVLARCSKSLRLGLAIYLEGLRCVSRDGAVHWLELHARLAGTDADGRQQYAGTMTDVTDRTIAVDALKRSEGRLSEQSSMLRATLDNLDQGIVMIDGRRRVVVSNRRLDEMFNLPPGLLLDKPPLEKLLEWFWKDGALRYPDQQISLADAATLDLPPIVEHERPNGRIIEIRSVRLPDGGAVRMYADITERRQAELELHAAKDAAEAGSRARSEFLATMSHEIRTPLNGVIGLGSLLTGTTLDSVQRRYVDGLLRSGEHLLQLINDILDLSKLEAARMQLSREPVAVGMLVQNIVSMLNPRAVTKDVRLLHEVAPTVPPILLGDPGRLRQVLLNIAGNAVKFTDRGHVRISVDGGPVDAASASVTFSIADTGVGISIEDQALLFREFEQLDGSLSRRHDGTGLGLAISRRLTELMGSRIELESRPGEGSLFRFTLTLPIGQAAPAASDLEGPETTIAELARTRGGVRVLLAEDNETNQFVAATMLRNQGCTVDIVCDGHEAVAAIERDSYDVVLMDMMMPGMDGLTATRAIRALPGGDAVPILALTANAFAGDQAACLDAGMSGFLTKPITLPKLNGAVVAALLGSAVVAASALQPAVPGAGDEPLDPETIDSLRATYGGAVGRFLSLFVEDSTDRLARIDRLAAAGDSAAMVVEAHTLKGAALTFGCVEVGRLAADLEAAARTGATDLAPAAERLAAAFDRAHRDLERTFLQAA